MSRSPFERSVQKLVCAATDKDLDIQNVRATHNFHDHLLGAHNSATYDSERR